MSETEKSRKKIAVVQGDCDAVTVITDRAAGEGADIEILHDLEDVGKHLESAGPDVILLDLGLPITEGLRLLRTLKASCPDVPIITESESEANGPAFFSIEACTDGLILAPLDSAELKSMLWDSPVRH